MKQLNNLWDKTKTFLPWIAGLYLVMAAIHRVEQNSPSFSWNGWNGQNSRQSLNGFNPSTTSNTIDRNTGGFFSFLSSSQASGSQTGGWQVDCSAHPSADGLNLRQLPNGNIIALIPCNTSGVEVTGDGIFQDGITWIPVTYSGRSGWVAEGFLR